MTELKQISPHQVPALLEQGHVYIDVRSEPEFEQGRIPGALNVPIAHRIAAVMQPNAEFLQVMQAAFGKDAKLIVGCASGNRSLRAAQMLLQAGFTDVTNMPAGFVGSRDPFGRPIPGYSQQNLPIETGKPASGSYADVKGRTGTIRKPRTS
ncbi:MAG TPA: rhodanese-like domain-containing protein [Polyangiaceae bacterium]|jgi:rhodanese-related sulfurtransferase